MGTKERRGIKIVQGVLIKGEPLRGKLGGALVFFFFFKALSI